MQSGNISNVADASPPVIPDHMLLRPIGRGAYGEVWLARNVMGALRAVKVIWRRQFESDRPYDREFAGIQRYEPVSRSSGGLVHVLHVGRNDTEGYFYYVMELADDSSAECKVQSAELSKGGASISSIAPSEFRTPESYVPRTLRSDLQRLGRLSTAECLRLALDVVGGLAQLHRVGLVHRDVKPGNIIYVHNQAKLADLGLVSGGGEGRTFVGTEGYIPPEGPGSAVADLYALGVVLYEASTGFAPERFPDVPTEWFATAEGDHALELHEVTLKACESQRERRYQSTDQLQADLALLQSGQSVRRARALERRYARLRLSGIAGTALLACALITALFSGYRARLAAESRAKETALRQQAQQAQVRAEAAEQKARQQLYTALLEQARSTVRSGELGQRVNALDAIRRAAAISNTAELRREAFAALALADLRFERELPTGLDCTMAVLDPKFERLAMCRGTNAVEIRSVPNQKLLATLAATADQPAISGKWSPNGRFLAIRRDRRGRDSLADISVWDVATGRQVLSPQRTHYGAYAFHPTQFRLLIADPKDSVVVWDLESGQELNRFALTGLVQHLEFSPKGENFIVHREAEEKGITSIHNATKGAMQWSAVTGWIDDIAWDPRNRWVALATGTGEVLLRDLRSGETTTLGRHKNEVRTATFTPDGSFLFTGGEEQEIICWDLRLRQRAFTVSLQSARVQFSADGEKCAVMTKRGMLLHSFERAVPSREMTSDLGGGVNRGAISPDGRWLAAAGAQRVALWDLTQEGPGVVATEAINATPVFSPDASELFAFWNDGLLRWRIKPGPAGTLPKLVSLPIYKPGRIYSVSFAPGSLLLGIPDGAVVIPKTEISSGPGELFKVGVAKALISPNVAWVAIRKGGQHFENVFRLKPWDALRFLDCDAEPVAEAFAPGSDEFAVATYTSVTFFGTKKWEPNRRFPAAVDRNAELMFSPDGRAVWLTCDAHTAALHDTQTFETLLPLPSVITPLALTPDGRFLAVSVDRRRLQVWDLEEVRVQLGKLGLNWRD